MRNELETVQADIARTAAVVSALAYITPSERERALRDSMRMTATSYAYQPEPPAEYYLQRDRLTKLLARERELLEQAADPPKKGG